MIGRWPLHTITHVHTRLGHTILNCTVLKTKFKGQSSYNILSSIFRDLLLFFGKWYKNDHISFWHILKQFLIPNRVVLLWFFTLAVQPFSSSSLALIMNAMLTNHDLSKDSIRYYDEMLKNDFPIPWPTCLTLAMTSPSHSGMHFLWMTQSSYGNVYDGWPTKSW